MTCFAMHPVVKQKTTLENAFDKFCNECHIIDMDENTIVEFIHVRASQFITLMNNNNGDTK